MNPLLTHGDSPIALHPLSIHNLLSHLLSLPSPPAVLIVCSSKADFLSQLLKTNDDDGGVSSSTLAAPTLENLRRASSLRIAYCDSVPALHAYLTAHSVRAAAGQTTGAGVGAGGEGGGGGSASSRAIVVWGAVALHRRTSSYSAQGIGRFVAAAVDAAKVARGRLVLAEGYVRTSARAEFMSGFEGEEEMEIDGSEWREGLQEDDDDDESGGREDPWALQVPILNATTRTFGPGERGWMGRTVEIKRIVGRWCSFKHIATGEANEEYLT